MALRGAIRASLDSGLPTAVRKAIARGLVALLLIAGPAANRPALARTGEDRAEWVHLEKQIAFSRDHAMPERLRRETLRPDALIWPGDRDALDVLLRRTRALLTHLERAHPEMDWAADRAGLAEGERRAQELDPTQVAQRQTLFAEVQSVRRRLAFQNPLLGFTDIVFLTHHRQGRGDVHMVDQYEGHTARPGGGLYVLRRAFSAAPEVEEVLAESVVANGRLRGQRLEQGSFISLELDYDAAVVYFAWTQARDVPADASWAGQFWTRAEAVAAGKPFYYWSPETCYHVFRARLDGRELVQLTDGSWNDFDPCVLPNGRLVFVSERRGGFLRCGERPNPTYTLHGMTVEGADLIPLSSHETHEWHPSVAHDGRIIYSRWDYVDRDSDIAHHPWMCQPDGRDPRALHGNYPSVREHRPWMELSIRAVPGSPRYVAVAAAHHGENYGSLVLVDPRVPDDGACSQLKRITPEVHFPESEMAPGVPGPTHQSGNRRGQVYGQPWPLSDDFHLVVYDPEEKHYGLYLLDSFGNRIHLYTDPEVPCLDPMPLQRRARPPVIPSQTTQALVDRARGSTTNATVGVMNVYDAALPWPEGTVIKALRIVQVFPKTTRIANDPNMGVGNQSLGRGVLGTVPVEPDGSAYFELPPDLPVYFQALDERGRAVQTMRSVTYAHRGERLLCQGCHERRQATPPASGNGRLGLAFRRAPSPLEREVAGAWPLTFPRLVQPVLDRQCVGCHQREPEAPSLAATPGKYGWSEAYHTLGAHAWAKHGGNGWLAKNLTSYSLPGQVGARASALLRLLEAGHHDVVLDAADWHRLTLWLDLNSNFYGVYHDPVAQARGERVAPILQ